MTSKPKTGKENKMRNLKYYIIQLMLLIIIVIGISLLVVEFDNGLKEPGRKSTLNDWKKYITH